MKASIDKDEQRSSLMECLDCFWQGTTGETICISIERGSPDHCPDCESIFFEVIEEKG